MLFMASMLISAPVSASNEYKPLPAEFAGSMMPYDFSRTEPVPATGDTLVPVFISYLGRHGSRYLSSRRKMEPTLEALEKARKEGMLSEKGEQLYAFVTQINNRTKKKWGMLSAVGIAEEQKLGSLMAENYPSLFKDGEVSAKSTYYPRVILTMYEFLHSLEAPHKELELYTQSGHSNDSLLHFFTYNKEFDVYMHDGEWKSLYADFVKRHVSSEIMSRYFKPGYIKDRQQLRMLGMELYGVLQGCAPSGFGPATDEWITPEEYQQCFLAYNFQHYLRNSINPLSQLAGTAVSPLLDQMIRDIDGWERNPGVKMKGYFGHAETLIPLVSLMAIPGCISMNEDYETLYRRWDVNRISPLAANLEMVLYRSNTGRLYVNVRLNGRNVYPLPDNAAHPSPFIPWPALRAFWLSRIATYAHQ